MMNLPFCVTCHFKKKKRKKTSIGFIFWIFHVPEPELQAFPEGKNLSAGLCLIVVGSGTGLDWIERAQISVETL